MFFDFYVIYEQIVTLKNIVQIIDIKMKSIFH